jgi:hypothetical protein
MNAAMTLILACVGIFGFFVMLFGFLLLLRFINYREKVKLADKGVFVQEETKSKPKKGLLIAGWIITLSGFVATIAFWLFGISVTGSGYGYGFPLGLGPWVLLGLFPFLLGLILLLIYAVRSPSGNGNYSTQNQPSGASESGIVNSGEVEEPSKTEVSQD